MNELYLGNFELAEAKGIKLRLESVGIDCEIRANEHTCNTKNCKVTVELWGNEANKEQFAEFFRQDFFKNLGDHEVNLEAMNAVFDPTASEVVCQACSAKFSPNLSECPDCGLCY